MKTQESLRKLIQTNEGIITRGQALAHGVGRHAIDHAISTGRWQRIHRGVYATFSGDLEERHLIRAALLHAGDDAILSGAAACRGYGLKYVPDAPLIVLVPAHIKRRPIRGVEIWRTRVMPRPRSVHAISCAPPERAALDACNGTTTLDNVRAILCEVVQRGLTTPERLISTAQRMRRGGPLVRRALDDIDVGCRSNPECEARDLIRVSTILPEPIWNQPLYLGGEYELFTPLIPDARWKEASLVLEVDSAEWHRFGNGPEETERRRSRYAAAGQRVFPVSPRRIRDDPTAVLGELEAAYMSGLTATTAGSLSANTAPMRARM